MTNRIIMVRRGDMLVPAGNEQLDSLRKLPTGVQLGVTAVQPRNLQFHRKAFALIKLAFDYWQPTNFVTTVETQTVRHLADYLCQSGLDANAVSALCSQFMQHLNAKRAQTLEAEKDIEQFRTFVTIQAGFYDTVMTPAGPKRVAKSWSFTNMNNDQFSDMYRQLMTVCWNLVLSQTFESPEAAEQAANQLINFDG